MKPTLLILAAGMGSRYGSLKQIDAVGPAGEAIIDYSIYDAIRAGFEKVIFVIRESIEKDFKEVFGEKLEGKIKTEFVFQELDMIPEGFNYSQDRQKPWGTAHAVWVARDHIQEPFVVINADDFYGPGSYRAMAGYLGSAHGKNSYCMMGYQVQHTLSDHGSVSRGVCVSGDRVLLDSVVERTEITMEADSIYFVDDNSERVLLEAEDLVSMNIWGFTPSVFDYIGDAFSGFLRSDSGRLNAELYIPAVVNDLIARGEANVRILPAEDRWFGVTYKEDKPLAVNNIKRLIMEGVYPENLWA